MKYTRLKSETDLKNDLNKKVDYCQSAAEAWGKVRVICKKDGSPFANFRRNFVGVDISCDYNNEHLTVYFHTSYRQYETDTIHIENEDVEEVTRLIEQRINQLNEYIESYTKLISRSEEIHAKLEEMENEELKYLDSVEKETGIKYLEYKFGALGYKD